MRCRLKTTGSDLIHSNNCGAGWMGVRRMVLPKMVVGHTARRVVSLVEGRWGYQLIGSLSITAGGGGSSGINHSRNLPPHESMLLSKQLRHVHGITTNDHVWL
uniref:Uncharacterized protein n=1 Tax=Knipowitschia caucasica TaxID=637954 RepID=A0AAV2LZB1_KNICA